MAKRFTDSDKWKKTFLRNLPSVYKIFWLYLCDDCSNCGIWETSEIDIAMIRTGEKINLDKALKLFNKDEARIHVFDKEKKWFIPSFVTFQYGDDFAQKASKNRLIGLVINTLTNLSLLSFVSNRYPLEPRYNGEQDKDKDKDMDKDKDKEGGMGGSVNNLIQVLAVRKAVSTFIPSRKR